MTSQSGFVVENKFTQGLITQNTAINFPQDACTDTLNCVFDEFGTVTRRTGFDQELNGVARTVTAVPGDAFSEFTWYTSSATLNKAFFCQQVGATLYFYDITSGSTVSLHPFTSFNLASNIPDTSTLNPASFRCQYATGNGKLIVTNPAIDTVLFTYDDVANSIDNDDITIFFRDLEGINDDMAVDERPTISKATLISDFPEHFYNLLNQGWGSAGDPLTAWDADNSDMPSNADAVSYFRQDRTDTYLTGSGAATAPGNTPAPKGHFILNLGVNVRADATGLDLADDEGVQEIFRGTGTIFGDFDTSTGAAFDDYNYSSSTNSAAKVASSTNGYIGKNFGTSMNIQGAYVYAPKDKGFADTGTSVIIELYGKTGTAPSSSTNGTLLGTTGTIVDNIGSVYIASTDAVTNWKYVWVRVRNSSGASDIFYVSEIRLITPLAYVARPKCVAFFAGRAFYAGVSSADTGANIYFSQVVLRDNMFGDCYQINDPTSEQFADLLATDGGVIKIPEIGYVQKLFPFQASLLVFASNGTWLIKGSAGDGFAATGYRVQRLSNIGMTSPESVTDVKGVPIWWAEDGLYTVEYDPRFDSTTVKSLTEETIKGLVLSVPVFNRPYIKATFDKLNNYVYFLYNDVTDLSATSIRTFNKILVFNAKTSAFFVWGVDSTVTSVPTIVGGMYVQDGDHADTFAVKYPILYISGGSTFLTYGEFRNTSYLDWSAMSVATSTPASAQDYSSYIIAGYRIDAQAMRNFQSKYVWTFMNAKDNSSVFLQGLWDFTNNSLSGKWSTPQQAYNSLSTRGRQYDFIRISRRVVRGTGKALQVKYYSETGKPFEIIGWGIFESGNSDA